MQKVSGFFVAIMQRYLPDPWLFAIVLTFVVFFMGIGFTGSSALDMVQFWGEGLFGLLEFSMQMVLILVTGYVLARTRIVRHSRFLHTVGFRTYYRGSAGEGDGAAGEECC